jgi:Domain of unknown function (DUF4278)
MKLHFHGASYEYYPHSFVDIDELETIGKFRGNTYKIRRSIAIAPSPRRKLKYRGITY